MAYSVVPARRSMPSMISIRAVAAIERDSCLASATNDKRSSAARWVITGTLHPKGEGSRTLCALDLGLLMAYYSFKCVRQLAHCRCFGAMCKLVTGKGMFFYTCLTV